MLIEAWCGYLSLCPITFYEQKLFLNLSLLLVCVEETSQHDSLETSKCALKFDTALVGGVLPLLLVSTAAGFEKLEKARILLHASNMQILSGVDFEVKFFLFQA